MALGPDKRASKLDHTVANLLDNGSKLQAPAVTRYVERLRRAHPDESPAQIVARMEKMFLRTVTGTGSAVGATAAVPGIGTIAVLGAAAAETVFYLEAAALFTLGVAAVHGIEAADHDQRRALVLAVALGSEGAMIVERTVGKTSKHWGKLLGGKIPGVKGMNESLLQRFLKKYALKRGALLLGKAVPAGIGAVIGGVGNRTLGKRTIDNARNAFGPPPATWPQPHRVVDADPLPALSSVPSRP